MKYGLGIFIIENWMKSYVSRNPGLSLLTGGWGNGYVLIPPNHPFYGIDYNNIHDKYDIFVHGGLTYSDYIKDCNNAEWIGEREIGGDLTLDNISNFDDYWMIGFDTNHYNDNEDIWTKESVLNETLNLLEQCLDEKNESIKKYCVVYKRLEKLKKISK